MERIGVPVSTSGHRKGSWSLGAGWGEGAGARLPEGRLGKAVTLPAPGGHVEVAPVHQLSDRFSSHLMKLTAILLHLWSCGIRLAALWEGHVWAVCVCLPQIPVWKP